MEPDNGELPNGFHPQHAGIAVFGLQMGHRLKGIDAGDIAAAQDLLLQEAAHEQRALQPPIGEVRRGGIDIARGRWFWGELAAEPLAGILALPGHADQCCQLL